MTRWILRLPFIVILMGAGALAMLIPAMHAAAVEDFPTARAFLYASLLFLMLFAMIGVATSSLTVRRQGRSYLISMVSMYAALPLMLAVPFYEAVGDTSFLSAYFEMISSLTTTGATLFPPERLSDSAHLWRALVGWLGGFFVWVTATAILAPLSLGGFEVRSESQIGQGAGSTKQITRVADMSERLQRYSVQLFPIYAGLTGALWAALLIAGDTPLVAVCHAMSTLSTSGISPIEGGTGTASGIPGEAILMLFLVFALSRVTFANEDRSHPTRALTRDPELRLGLLIVGAMPVLLLLRHWFGALEVAVEGDFAEALRAYWGGLFTVASFLTTTGFESVAWSDARVWSGLPTPGLILMGLAVFGGGVGTTAGGVKLLRVYALYQHGLREMEKLAHPHSVGGAGRVARQIRRQGAQVAWVFFMLFAISIALTMLAFSLTGLDFEQSLVLTIAALSTTGPLAEFALDTPIDLALLSGPAKVIMNAAMIVGRLETLAIIALLNPDFWRN